MSAYFITVTIVIGGVTIAFGLYLLLGSYFLLFDSTLPAFQIIGAGIGLLALAAGMVSFLFRNILIGIGTVGLALVGLAVYFIP